MRHAKAMAVVVAYDIYLEVAEGELNEEWGLRVLECDLSRTIQVKR